MAARFGKVDRFKAWAEIEWDNLSPRLMVVETRVERLESDRAALAKQLAGASRELELEKAQTAALVAKAAPRSLSDQHRRDFIQFTANAAKEKLNCSLPPVTKRL